MPALTNQTGRAYHILGVPLRTGSLYPGSENDAGAYREARLLERLRAAGCDARDEGDLAIPSYLPHHAVPPIRSWPGPRIVWDLVSERIAPLLQTTGHVPLLVGCDCSIVVGTVQALARSGAQDIHVIYVDGDFDDAPPESGRSQSAASLALWLLTRDSPFWAGPALDPSRVTVVGWSNPSRSEPQQRPCALSLADVRRLGAHEAARQALDAIPASASVVLHFDIDVLQRDEMPAAYFPHAEGLTLSEGAELIAGLLRDSRMRIIEVSEYASLRDLDQRWIDKLVGLLADGLRT